MKRRGLWKWLSIAFSLFVATAAIGVSFIDVGYAATSGTLTGLLDESIGLSYSGDADNVWTANGKTVTGTARGKGGTCGDTHYSSTLTITSKKDKAATLSFDYVPTLSSGEIQIDGNNVTNSGNFVKENLAPNQSVAIYFKTGSTSADTKIVLNNIALFIDTTVTTTFIPSSGGTLTVDGVAITAEINKKNQSSKVYQVKALADSSHDFLGWNINGAISQIDNPLEFQSDADSSISPCFIDKTENEGAYYVDGLFYNKLEDALSAAKLTGSSGKIILKRSGTVQPKPDGSAYKISNGTTFVLPNGESCNPDLYCADVPPANSSQLFLKDPFVTWTLQSNTKILVENGGVICVAGDSFAASGGNNISATPVGTMGEVVLNEGSIITLESGSKLYCYGYITGTGSVEAKSGSEVHELFQFHWRGGSAGLRWQAMSTTAFFFNQYYIQNIECKLRIYGGAAERLAFAFIMNDSVNCSGFEFIGQNGLFVLEDSTAYLERKYMPSTGRIHYWLYGDASLSHIALNLLSINVDSKKSHMPIMNNLDLEICSGETKILNDFALLPGSSIKVHEEATLTIQTSAKVFLYDSRDWVGKGFAGDKADYLPTKNLSSWLRKQGYSPKTIDDFQGACIDVNGSANIAGKLLRTNSSDSGEVSSQSHNTVGKIVSTSQCGKVTYASGYTYNSSDSQKTQQLTGSAMKLSSNSLTTTAVLFENDSESYFAGSVEAGGRVVYKYDASDGKRKWMGDKAGAETIAITFVWQDGSTTKEFEGGDVNLPVAIGDSGNVVLWYETESPENFYKPGVVQPSIISSITVTAFYGGWYKAGSAANSDRYYFDTEIGMAKGLYRAESEDSAEYNVYLFDKDGVFQSNITGVFYYDSTAYGSGDNQYYYLDKGVVLADARWQVKITATTAGGGSARNDYYYFGNGNTASKNQTIGLSSSQTNSVFPDGYFTFGSEGRLESFAANGAFDWDAKTIVLQDDVCYYESVRAGIGLFTSDTHIYYAKDDGSIMTNGTYYVEEGKLNGKATNAGLYYFDANGYLCDSMMNPIEVTPPEANA